MPRLRTAHGLRFERRASTCSQFCHLSTLAAERVYGTINAGRRDDRMRSNALDVRRGFSVRRHERYWTSCP